MVDDAGRRRQAIEAEIRECLGLPGWSNLRGDDVIDRIQALDEAARVRVTGLLAELQEIKDEEAARRTRQP